MRKLTTILLPLCSIMVLLSGCAELSGLIDQLPDPPPPETNAPVVIDEPEPGPVTDLSFIEIWKHQNVSEWAVTADLTVSQRPGSICLDSSKKGAWPVVQEVAASAWVVYQEGGKWTASTFEYMRPNQVCKGAGFYIGRWRPQTGERIGFMISGLARDHRRTVEERSPLVWWLWNVGPDPEEPPPLPGQGSDGQVTIREGEWHRE